MSANWSALDYPEGIPVYSQEKNQLFVVNGIQTQSGLCYYLQDRWQELAASGVDIFRFSAHSFEVMTLAGQLAQAMAEQSTLPTPTKSMTATATGTGFREWISAYEKRAQSMRPGHFVLNGIGDAVGELIDVFIIHLLGKLDQLPH